MLIYFVHMVYIRCNSSSSSNCEESWVLQYCVCAILCYHCHCCLQNCFTYIAKAISLQWCWYASYVSVAVNGEVIISEGIQSLCVLSMALHNLYFGYYIINYIESWSHASLDIRQSLNYTGLDVNMNINFLVHFNYYLNIHSCKCSFMPTRINRI